MPADQRMIGCIQEQAIGWVIRLRDADEQTWEAFTVWLEADPAHLAAYDEAALADVEAEELRLLPMPQPVRFVAPAVHGSKRGPVGSRRRFLGWAAAASIVLSAGYFAVSGRHDTYTVETAPGERRVIALDDGSRIELNGGSRMELDRERPRFARLERGEALFEVVHDSNRAFQVEAGGTLLHDLGTVFNVVAEKEWLEVAVSEGAVLYDPRGAARKLTPGVVLRRKGARAKVEPIPTDAVGGWRRGRLVYSAASIATIAGDLSRNLGLRITAQEAVASRPFSGVILLSGQPQEALERSAALLGLQLQRSGDTWLLTRGSAAD